MKQGARELEKDECEVIDNPTRGNYEVNKYEVPSLPPVPTIPHSEANEVVTYENIPGDM